MQGGGGREQNLRGDMPERVKKTKYGRCWRVKKIWGE